MIWSIAAPAANQFFFVPRVVCTTHCALKSMQDNKPKPPCLRLACLMYLASNLICNLLTNGLNSKRNTG
jgi:hypothetical protein